MGFVVCATSLDPDQTAPLCHLIWIYTGCFMVKNKLMDLTVNTVDPDQMALFSHVIKVIYIYMYME
jgi:hypothetical protein